LKLPEPVVALSADITCCSAAPRVTCGDVVLAGLPVGPLDVRASPSGTASAAMQTTLAATAHTRRRLARLDWSPGGSSNQSPSCSSLSAMARTPSQRKRCVQLVVVVVGFVIDVDGVVVEDVESGVDVVVVVGRSGAAGAIVVEVWSGAVVVVVVVVVVGAVPVSVETQPEGTVETPPWPGIRTVPAHPKLEKWASSVTRPPSRKLTVDADSRMNPDASIETRSRMVW
jgi:hypothetical protein